MFLSVGALSVKKGDTAVAFPNDWSFCSSVGAVDS